MLLRGGSTLKTVTHDALLWIQSLPHPVSDEGAVPTYRLVGKQWDVKRDSAGHFSSLILTVRLPVAYAGKELRREYSAYW